MVTPETIGRDGMRIAFMLAAAATLAYAPAPPEPVTIPVTLAPTIVGPVSGRLIVFAQKAQPDAKPVEAVDSSPFSPTETAVAAREVAALSPGEGATVDAETDSYPAAFSKLAPGLYRFQAVLDRNHDYNYGGRGAGDIVSPVVEARLPGPAPRLVLTTIVPEPDAAAQLARAPEAVRNAVSRTVAVDFVSPR